MATFQSRRRTTRMSLSSVPGENKGAHKEQDMALANKKKRSKSLGGEALSELAIAKGKAVAAEELSPRKKARRSLVPGRSILKARPNPPTSEVLDLDNTTSNFTSIFGGQQQPNNANVEEGGTRSEDEEEGMDMTMATMHGGIMNGGNDETMDFTEAVGGIGGRKSLGASALARRVSFAPTAHIRLFDNELDGSGNPLGSSPTSSSPSGSSRMSDPPSPTPNASSPVGGDSVHGGTAQEGVTQLGASDTSSPKRRGHRRASSISALPQVPTPLTAPAQFPDGDSEEAWLRENPAQAADLEEEERSLTMEMAGEEVTSAFGGFAPARDNSGSAEEDEDEGESSMAMSVAGDEVTSAFRQNTHIGGLSSLTGGSKFLGAVGFGPKKPSRLSIAFSAMSDEEDEAEENQNADDDGKAEDSEKAEDGEDEQEKTVEMDITMPQHGGGSEAQGIPVLWDGHTSRRISVSGFARRASVAPATLGKRVGAVDEEREDVTMEVGESSTATMEETRAVGAGIISSQQSEHFSAELSSTSLPVVPADIIAQASVEADEFQRDSTPPRSPRRRSASPAKRNIIYPPPRRASPPRDSVATPSPRRITSAAPSTPRSASRIPVPASSFPDNVATYAAPSSLASRNRAPLQRSFNGSPAAASPSKNISGSFVPSPKKQAVATRRSPMMSPAAKRVVRLTEQDDSSMSLSFIGDDSLERGPQMTLDDFLDATNIKFMENAFKMTKRKSLAPSGAAAGLLGRHKVEDEDEDEDEDTGDVTGKIKKPSLAAHVHAAAARIPLLELRHTAAQELKYGLKENEQFIASTSLDVAANPPTLFKEWTNATDDQRSIMGAQYKMLKTHFSLVVRNEWYDYKTAMVNSLKEHLEGSIASLKRDHEVLLNTQRSLEAELPDLKARREALLAEVQKERARKADLDAIDKDHLASLKDAIIEQATVLDEFRGEAKEVDGQLQRLNAKLAEAAHQKADHAAVIANGRAACEQMRCFTKTELFRLRDELNALQIINGWVISGFRGSVLDMHFCDEIAVRLELAPKAVRDIKLQRLAPLKHQLTTDKAKEATSEFFLRRMEEEAQSLDGEVKDILRKIGRMWTLAHRLRHEILLARTVYPLTIKSSHQPFRLYIAFRIHAEAVKASFDVAFELSGEEIVDGVIENVTEGVGCEVKVAFGSIDAQELTYVVRDRISRAGRGNLLKACQEAEASANGRAQA